MKLPVVFIFLFFFSIFHARSQDNCHEILERAEMLFDQGMIEQIPDLLDDCLKNGFNSDERIRANKLLINSYLFDNRFQNAERAMVRFLRDTPGYRIHPDDPAEFSALFSSFRTIPFLSLGVFIGVNLSTVTLLEPYGPYDTSAGETHFSMTEPEYQAGAGLSIFVSDRVEFNIEGIYTRTSFLYSSLQYDFARIEKSETHQRMEFPVSFTYDLLTGKWRPYLRLGASYGLIISATGDYKRSYINASASFEPLESRGVNITGSRTTGSVNAVGGAGLKYRIPGGDLTMDLRYFYGLTNLVNTESRWNQETVFPFYHADGDFLIDYFTFSIGFRFSFFQIKKH